MLSLKGALGSDLMRFALVIAVAAVLASSAAAMGPFTTKTLAGTWTGSWTDETFGSSGPVTFVATPLANSRLRLSVDFGGGVFGCCGRSSARSSVRRSPAR